MSDDRETVLLKLAADLNSGSSTSRVLPGCRKTTARPRGFTNSPPTRDSPLHIGLSYVQGYALNRAWQEIPPSVFVALRDTIRNRILKLTLEIKDELGTANDDIHAIPPTKVEQSVTTYIYGGTNVIAGTAHHFAQIGGVNAEPSEFLGGRDVTHASGTGQ